MWPVFERNHSKLITFFWCFKLVLWLWCFWSAKTIVVSELKSTLRNSSHLSASSRRRLIEDVKGSEWCCLQNEDGVENTLGTTNYSFSSLCRKNYFVLKAALPSFSSCTGCPPKKSSFRNHSFVVKRALLYLCEIKIASKTNINTKM